MPKHCFFFVFLFVHAAHAQVVLPSLLQINQLKPIRIALEAKKTPANTAFTSFAIQDLRQDTTTLGYIRFTPEYKKYNRLEFENGIASATDFLNHSFATNRLSDTARLVVVLKNIYLTQEYSPVGMMSLANVRYVSKAFVSARLLLFKKETYCFLGDVDTVIAVQRWFGKCYTELATTALLHLVDKGGQLLQTAALEAVSYHQFIASSKPKRLEGSRWKNGFYQHYADFVKGANTPVSIQYEQRKKVRLIKPLAETDTALVRNSWGFVEDGILYIRKEAVYVPMQAGFGSYSGLGISFTEGERIALTGVLLQNPFLLAADMADMALNGTAAKMEHYRLMKLNTETGELE